MDSFKRKTPEEILLSISKLHRGTLKVYIGPVSGSGKTYHMLREGQALRQQGVDVVICAVSTLQRPETVEQLGDLERVPSIHWFQDGVEQKDLNLDSLLERNPEVVLVDALAHQNRPDARFETRLEDIQFLLAHHISVMTTVNVYELEGYTELAHKLTGIEPECTLPADTLELADEVRLIDVTPETILNRLAEGHLRGNKDGAVFMRGNLGVLRELALRLVAEDVHVSLNEHREEMGLLGPSGSAERILVTTQYHWNGSIYVRRGQQIAKRLNGDLLVVTYRDFKRSLSKEESAFRRSMVKLVEKVGGGFEELPFPGRRRIPHTLVKYAVQHHVTRMVMGHSKQTRWQELWQGSVVNKVLSVTRNMDVFLVANSAAQEGRRVLPVQLSSSKKDKQQYRRLSSAEVEERTRHMRCGKFKVYIGAAPGVGKTYMMLRDGNDLLKKGIDVRIGLLETHNRQETGEQMGSLPHIARQRIDYQGVQLEEMDTEAIIRSAPEVVLVDELAHTNVPGSKNKKRYEDVLDILEAGISVITTVNVQHLESLNDAVEQMTGIRVRETVPDHILQLADEVQLIDVAPEALQRRMREGKIYAMTKVDQALSNFFKTGNLIALRELALREIADDVDERLESVERTSSLRGPWRRQEVIFIGVNSTPHAERLIRRGFRMAYRLKAAWYVNYVQCEADMSAEMKQRIEALEKLTVRLGGKFIVHQTLGGARQIAQVLAARAEELGATQLVIGASKQTLWERLAQGSVVNRLIRRTRHMDVLIVADFDSFVAL
ncbi:universal stress protein [Paenibacillus sp. OV219]|uniref:universal stress protein n=1 Tax=Paenibacillus sp. OV219 TaxID=1884377 RepID=UPI0008B827A7|nr:universal stress protein [Paenibacillus sp. OV219]SEP13914.1 two-component system, OmpR family, sensor histidine kinase KdpD [Paenibacillus sp. OV219]